MSCKYQMTEPEKKKLIDLIISYGMFCFELGVCESTADVLNSLAKEPDFKKILDYLNSLKITSAEGDAHD